MSPIQTRWSDNDVYGHVNNVTYYSYFDTAVNGWLIDHGGLDIRVGAVVAYVVETSCSYFSPVAFPDRLHVGVRVARLGRSSVRYELAGVSRRRRASRGRRALRPRLRRSRHRALGADPERDSRRTRGARQRLRRGRRAGDHRRQQHRTRGRHEHDHRRRRRARHDGRSHGAPRDRCRVRSPRSTIATASRRRRSLRSARLGPPRPRRRPAGPTSSSPAFRATRSSRQRSRAPTASRAPSARAPSWSTARPSPRASSSSSRTSCKSAVRSSSMRRYPAARRGRRTAR